jgi:hypothetical protein
MTSANKWNRTPKMSGSAIYAKYAISFLESHGIKGAVIEYTKHHGSVILVSTSKTIKVRPRHTKLYRC